MTSRDRTAGRESARRSKTKASAAPPGRPLEHSAAGGSDPRIAQILALQRSVGNSATSALLRDGSRAPSRGAAHVLQRKLGFEFETGWTAYTGDKKLNKFDPIGTERHPGFKVESDDDGRVEFVIHPPLEIGPSLTGLVNGTFDGVDKYATRLIETAKHTRTGPVPPSGTQGQSSEQGASDDKSSSDDEMDDTEYEYNKFSLRQATNQDGDHAFTIAPRDDTLTAHPQSTVGLTLGQIAGLHTHVEKFQAPADMAASAVARPPSDFFDMSPAAELLGVATISPELTGFLMLVANYVKAGETDVPLEYPKMITDGWILARNDFPTLLAQTPERTSGKIGTGQGAVGLTKLVMRVVQSRLKEKDETAPVFSKGITKTPGRFDTAEPFGPTRAAWLNGIEQGSDLMTYAVDKAYESMGRLGNKTEPVATEKPDAPPSTGGIFEFRGGQTRPLEQEQWRAYAHGIAAGITAFQQDPDGRLEELNRREAAEALMMLSGL
jgi:hypothetical protein